MSGDAPRIHACLEVRGSFDPAALSALLGVEPAVSGRAGDPEPYRPGKTRDRDLWHFKTEEAADFDWPAHLVRILSMVRPRATEFREFCAAHDAEPAVHLVAYVDGGTPIGAFPAEVVRDIAELGCALGIDLYA